MSLTSFDPDDERKLWCSNAINTFITIRRQQQNDEQGKKILAKNKSDHNFFFFHWNFVG